MRVNSFGLCNEVCSGRASPFLSAQTPQTRATHTHTHTYSFSIIVRLPRWFVLIDSYLYKCPSEGLLDEKTAKRGIDVRGCRIRLAQSTPHGFVRGVCLVGTHALLS